MRSPIAAGRRTIEIFAATATAAVTLGMSAAHAGYAISSNALAGSNSWGCNVTYNMGHSGSYNGYSQYACAPSGASTNGVTVVYSGTTDSTGLARSTFQTSTAQPDVGGGYATATTQADLKTAKVKLYAQSSGFSSASADATLNDTLHFKIAGANANTVTYIPVSFKFDGKLSTPGVQGFGDSAYLFWGFFFGGASTYEYGYYGAGYYNGERQPVFAFPETTPGRTGGWQSYHFASYQPTDTRFSGVYAVTGATADIPISFGLGITSDHNVRLDYLNTGEVHVGHVSGVSYTSDSGVFGTGGDGGTSVPEPANMILFGLAVGTAGLVAGNRRQG